MLYTKEEIEEKLRSQLGMIKLQYEGLIRFFFKGELVGETQLVMWSNMEQRHLLAELCKVAEYDNFHIVRPNGDVTDASTVFMANLAIAEDVHIDRGLYEGLKYQIYKNKLTCDKCGSIRYEAKFPEQRDIVNAIYKGTQPSQKSDEK